MTLSLWSLYFIVFKTVLVIKTVTFLANINFIPYPQIQIHHFQLFRIVIGEGKFEEMMVASQEIAGSTAQLVIASRVRAIIITIIAIIIITITIR